MDNINLVRKLVWAFSKSATEIEIDDLFQEAILAYYENIHKYDAARGKITTFTRQVVLSRLKDYARTEHRKYIPTCDITKVNIIDTYHEPLWEIIPVDLYDIVNYIIQNASAIDCYTPIESRKYVRVMLFKAGYSLEQVRTIMKELNRAIINIKY